MAFQHLLYTTKPSVHFFHFSVCTGDISPIESAYWAYTYFWGKICRFVWLTDSLQLAQMFCKQPTYFEDRLRGGTRAETNFDNQFGISYANSGASTLFRKNFTQFGKIFLFHFQHHSSVFSQIGHIFGGVEGLTFCVYYCNT